MTSLIDIGANLTNKAFRWDLDQVLERALEARVGLIVVTGTNVETSQAAAELARSRPGFLFSTAGIHPHHARTVGPLALGALRDLAERPEVVAVGECGLDFNRNYSSPEDQLRCFEAELQIAVETLLPVFLHERDAHDAFARVIEKFRPKLPRAVVHCFTGTEKELDHYLALDLYIGITGWICDERRGMHLRELVRRVPSDRLMIETDAPYLLPRDMPGRPTNGRNETCVPPARPANCRDGSGRAC
jgi:TatD DNase family protein